MKKILSVISFYMLILPSLFAQNQDFLRSTGKVYSVVAVILVIFVGIVIFLYRLDNKLTKLEKQIKNEQ